MPNHTSTRLEITGDNAEIRRFIAAVNKSDEKPIDFQSLVPMPEELKSTYVPSNILTQVKIDEARSKWEALPQEERDKQESWMGKKGKYSFGITQEQYDELIAKYGAADWYDWNIKNWGTKWGAYDAGEWSIMAKCAEISYQTAWSPATAFYINASKQFPTLSFTHYFADEGGGFLGHETIKNGKVIKSVEIDWDSEEGINLRETLGCYFPEDEDEN